MLVRDFTEIAGAQHAVVEQLSCADTWASAIEGALDAHDRQVLARYGMLSLVGTPDGNIEVRVGSVNRRPRGVVVGIEWQASGRPDWEPVVQGDVTVSSIGPSLSHLDFAGTYFDRNGMSSAAADRVTQQRVLEYAVRLILNRLAGSVSGHVRL